MADEIIENITGEFVHCIYKSETYLVAKFKTEDDLITVTGPYFEYEKGQKYILKGYYCDHYSIN